MALMSASNGASITVPGPGLVANNRPVTRTRRFSKRSRSSALRSASGFLL